jgi:O-antigen ligase
MTTERIATLAVLPVRFSALRMCVVATVATAFLAALPASTNHPSRYLSAAIAAAIVLAAAFVRPRVALVVLLFALAGYFPDALLKSGSAGQAMLLLIAVAVVIRAATGTERLWSPRELLLMGAMGAALVVSSAFAADSAIATSRLVDFAGFTILIALMLLLIDSELWLRRAMWAVMSAIGLLGGLAIVQRTLHLGDVAFGGLATVLHDGPDLRSGGPLSANFFGEILATTAVLALYLALDARRPLSRVVAVTACICCIGALFDTGSRGALIALASAAIFVAILRKIRVIAILIVLGGIVVAGSFLLSPNTRARLSALSGVSASSIEQNASFRGRLSENLAAFEMWRAHPFIGVGPGNFETHYLSYATGLNLDQRAEPRSAHNLYLESLAETGLIGSVVLFGILGLALARAWRGARKGAGRAALLSEGALVALFAFLVAALTLHAAYPRFLWLFVGLALCAGRVAIGTEE